MIEVLDSEFVAVARAKGLGEVRVLFGHVARNALLPTVTLLGLNIAFLIGSTVIVEQVFNLNGLGSLLLSSILNRDFPVVQATTLVLGAGVVVVNLGTDLLAARLDPGHPPAMTTVLTPDEVPLTTVEEDAPGSVFFYRARHSKTFIAGTVLTVGLVMVAVLAPVLSPYPPNHRICTTSSGAFSPSTSSARTNWVATSCLGLSGPQGLTSGSGSSPSSFPSFSAPSLAHWPATTAGGWTPG